MSFWSTECRSPGHNGDECAAGEQRGIALGHALPAHDPLLTASKDLVPSLACDSMWDFAAGDLGKAHPSLPQHAARPQQVPMLQQQQWRQAVGVRSLPLSAAACCTVDARTRYSQQCTHVLTVAACFTVSTDVQDFLHRTHSKAS